LPQYNTIFSIAIVSWQIVPLPHVSCYIPALFGKGLFTVLKATALVTLILAHYSSYLKKFVLILKNLHISGIEKAPVYFQGRSLTVTQGNRPRIPLLFEHKGTVLLNTGGRFFCVVTNVVFLQGNNTKEPSPCVKTAFFALILFIKISRGKPAYFYISFLLTKSLLVFTC